MDIFSIAVCDDNSAILGVIAGAAESVFRVHETEVKVRCFGKIKDLRETLKNEKYDLLFLDIDMPDGDGIEYAKELKASNESAEIVFVSSREDRVFDALSVHPFGFVRKSQFLKDISAVADAFYKEREKKNGDDFIIVQTHAETANLPIRDIVYFEGNGKMQLIHIKNRNEPMQLFQSLDVLEKSMEKHGFLRIHKGYLVNFRWIRLILCDEAVLTDGSKLPVSRRKYQDIKNQYLALMQSGGAKLF